MLAKKKNTCTKNQIQLKFLGHIESKLFRAAGNIADELVLTDGRTVDERLCK